MKESPSSSTVGAPQSKKTPILWVLEWSRASLCLPMRQLSVHGHLQHWADSGRGHRDSISIAEACKESPFNSDPSNVASLLEEPHHHLHTMRSGKAQGSRCFLSRVSTIPSSTHWGIFPTRVQHLAPTTRITTATRSGHLQTLAPTSDKWHHETALPLGPLLCAD